MIHAIIFIFIEEEREKKGDRKRERETILQRKETILKIIRCIREKLFYSQLKLFSFKKFFFCRRREKVILVISIIA